MDEIRTYRDLEVWLKARELALIVYDVTAKFPKEESYGLTTQMRRAAISIPSNIAEGVGRGTYRGTIPFLFSARGSLYELETQLFDSFRTEICEQGGF